MNRLRLAGGLILAIALTTAQGGGKVPVVTPPGVTREFIDLAGADEGHTPARLNRSVAFRYFMPGAPDPTAVLVLVPGVNSGPNTLDLLARALTAASGARLGVWVVAPRSTLLQDRRGIETAVDYQNPDFALGYYYGKLPIEGTVFHPVSSDEAPYAAYWGLDVHLRDIRAVIQEVHRRFPGAPLFLGGHSLGAILATLYAGYDFGRLPGPTPVERTTDGLPVSSVEAGARDIRGLLLLDGVPLGFLRRLSEDQYMHGFRIPGFGRFPGVEAMTASDPHRRAGPFTDSSGLARTQDSILLNVITAYAYMRPEDASALPFYPRKGLAITNEALLGAILSDQMQPDLFIRASVGRPIGRFPRIPDPASVHPEGLLDLQRGRPAPGETLIRWISDDLDPHPGHVDIRELEEAILRPGGDFTEWYMPWRIFLDLGLADRLDTSDAFARRFVSLTQVRYTALPMLVIGAGLGLIRHPGDTLFYRSLIRTPSDDVRVEIIPRYTHLDLETAAHNRAVPLILAWLEGVLH